MSHSEIDREFELGEMPDWVTEDPAPVAAPVAASAPAGVVPFRRPRPRQPKQDFDAQLAQAIERTAPRRKRPAEAAALGDLLMEAVRVAGRRRGRVTPREAVLLEVLGVLLGT